MKNITYDRLKDFERDPSNNFLTRSEMMEAVEELIALREAQKGEQVPVITCYSCRKVMTRDQHAEADGFCPHCDVEIELDEDGELFTAPQKPCISKEKLCDWLEDNFDIDDCQRDAFANCFAHHCNCIVKDGDW